MPQDQTSLMPINEPPTALAQADRAMVYAEQSRAEATKRAYTSDWQRFSSWCELTVAKSLPASPQTVAAYIAHLADQGKAVATIVRALASISQAHQIAGYDSPSRSEHVRTVLKGIKRANGIAQRQAAAATVPVLRQMIDSLPDNLLGIRDRALLLIGFAGALRRSELVALTVADIEFVSEGVVITVRRSKTDQDAAGRQIGIPFGMAAATCPVGALQAWLDATGIADGPIFRRVDRWQNLRDKPLAPQAVALIVKAAAERAGLDADRFSGHSLRAGLATAAAEAGANGLEIALQTGHKSQQMVARYVRKGSLFRGNVAGRTGL